MMRVLVLHLEEEGILGASKAMVILMGLDKIRCLNARHAVITVMLSAPGCCLLITWKMRMLMTSNALNVYLLENQSTI